MNKQIAIELDRAVREAALAFSNPNREMNPTHEVFEVEKVLPASDLAAVVIFKKNTGKKGLAFFYYVARGKAKGWKYFFPTDEHVLGFRAFEIYKLFIEDENYKYNFK